MTILTFVCALLTSTSVTLSPVGSLPVHVPVSALQLVSDSLNRQQTPLTAFVGSYEISPNMTMDIRLNDGKLVAQPQGDPEASELKALGGLEFEVVGQNSKVTFQQDTTGKVTGMVVHFGSGRSAKARKL